MNRKELFNHAYIAKSASSKKSFIASAKQVVFYFFGVKNTSQLQRRLRKQNLTMDFRCAQDWIDLIDGLWMVVSDGHADRHAVERLIERMSDEKWWASISSKRVCADKVRLAIA